MKKLTKDEFIKKANVVHQNFYDYNDVVYINMHTKVKINLSSTSILCCNMILLKKLYILL